jgi:predicted extracellular nuclease
MQLEAGPTVVRSTAARTETLVTLGQFNVWNWFDTVNDPHTRDTIYEPEQYRARIVKLAGLIARDLGGPDIVTLQEIENATVLDDLLAAPQLRGLGYRYVLSNKADTRGIRNAFLYRPERVVLRSVEEPNPISTLPPEDPQLIGHDRLFARVSQVATFSIAGEPWGAQARAGAFTIINNHFKSKVGGPFWEPRRQAQGTFIGGLVDAIRGAEPTIPVIVTGDLNATWADGAYQKLQSRPDGSARLHDALAALPDEDRYTYVYRKSPFLLDHVLVTPDLVDAIEGVRILHLNTRPDSLAKRFNSGTTHGTSDHDPVLTTIRIATAPGR